MNRMFKLFSALLLALVPAQSFAQNINWAYSIPYPGTVSQAAYQGNLLVQGNTTATGSVTAQSLTVSGTSTLAGITSTGSLAASGSANTLTVAGSATTAPTTITATGTDTNIGITLAPKGTGVVTLSGPTTVSGSIGSAGSADTITINGSAATSPVTVAATGSDTNISLSLSPKGTGIVQSSGPLGYQSGASVCGAVTQATSRTTGVTLNKPCGQITMFSAAGATTAATFTVTDSTVAAADTVIVNEASGTNLYELFVTSAGAGSFNVTFFTTGGVATDAPVLNFSVVKSANN